MSISAISSERTVPISEDLTTEEKSLSVIRGLEDMKRVDKKLKSGETFALGEWAVINSDGEAERAGGSAVHNTYPVFAGTDRFDVHATGQVTLIMNSAIIAKTNKFNPAPSYVVGMPLTVKAYSAGKSELTEATGGDAIVARVHDASEVANGCLVYETVQN